MILYSFSDSIFLLVVFKKVVSTKYDESGQLWSVVTRSPDGAEQIYTSKVLTICTGQEAIPKIPHFDGESSFPGRILHSQVRLECI